VYEKWSPVSRVAVFAPSKHRTFGHEVMTITNDAGAPTALNKFDGDFSKLDFIEEDARQTVHAIKKNADVLVIGSAGGFDVLVSLRNGHKSVTAVEINPVIGELVTETYADYIGNIFSDPRVNLNIQEGRNFAAGSPDMYDIVEITMIDSWGGAAAGAYVFNENALYTYEAVRDYVAHLRPEGVLSMTRYLNWHESLRLTATYVQYLRDQGVEDISKRMVVVAERKKGYRRATVLLKKDADFTKQEVLKINKVARRAKGALIWGPHVKPKLFMKGEELDVYRAVINSADQAEFDQIVADFPANIEPSTDDQPFFFFTTRFSDVFNPDAKDHPARRVALPLLYGMLGFFALLASLTIFLPLYLRSSDEIRQAPYRVRSLAYFSMLGVGFMLIELSLIQRLTVFLGHPIWSFVIVLSTLLAAGGTGSYISARWKKPEQLMKILLAVVAITGLYSITIYDQLIELMYLSKPARMVLAVFVTALPGFVLGMCFPVGMSIIQRFHGALVPWGWGVNGAFSVFGSILSIVLALNFGFKAAMGVGVICYIVAAALIASLRGVALPAETDSSPAPEAEPASDSDSAGDEQE
jgi:spermidine synthase